MNDDASDGDTSAAENGDANGIDDATESGSKSGSIGGRFRCAGDE